MAAHHHHFIFQLGVGAGNLGDGVETVLVIAEELGIHIHLDVTGTLRFQQAIYAAIAFDGHHHDWKRYGMVALVS